MALQHRPRICVIGAGRMARDCHLPSQQALAANGRSILAAVCDLDAAAAAKAAREFGAGGVYTDIDTMLRAEKPDGVVVIMPVSVTARVAAHVLKAGFPVLMEKPPGASLKECRAILAAARKGKAASMVAFNRRFCPVIVQGREEIAKRGAIKGATARMYRHLRAEPDFIYGTGIHSLDAVRFLGGDIESVETDRRVLAKGERAAFHLFIGFKNGGAGTLTFRPQAGLQLERYEVFGDEAVALIHSGVGWLIDAPGSCQVYVRNAPVRLADPLAASARAKRKLKTAIAGGFFGENAAFVDAIADHGDFSPSVEDALQSVEIAEAVSAGRNYKRR